MECSTMPYLTDDEVIAGLTAYLESMDMTVPPAKIRELVESSNRRQLGATMAERAKHRPSNYADLSPAEQWAVDKDLGILDWDGSPNT
jgi:hypothetical protein